METTSFRTSCLASKVALITGGGSGICKAITRKFMQYGCDTAILSRDELQHETGRRCLVAAADVRDYDAVSRAVDKVLTEYGQLDILVNGAAGNFLCPLEKLTYKGFKAVMEIDAHGTFIVSHIVFKKVFKYRGNGIILNISMTPHYTGALLQTHAGAAKAAVDAMTKHMAVEWGPYGVRVNGIAPGPIGDTVGLDRLNPFQSNTMKKPTGALEVQNKVNNLTTTKFTTHTTNHNPTNETDNSASPAEMMRMLIPLQRLGRTDDVAHSALFLCLPEASFITGATLVVDGGQWLTCCNFTVLEPRSMSKWINSAKEAQKSGVKMLSSVPPTLSKL
uniref:2,4-dienoyl-CoA reductase [(3E)-enoyl-CoA-producing] n=1 Tax=Cardiosporidium cionae TaxID=476202 RepID=A0A3Q8UBH8_9APIC|nr:peroxisomal 2,4-dienoyl-CoA reductase [Cardiosporidium cionae]